MEGEDVLAKSLAPNTGETIACAESSSFKVLSAGQRYI